MRRSRTAVCAATALVMAACGGAVETGEVKNSERVSAAQRQVAEASAAWWQHQLETNFAVRLQRGLKMERVPSVSEESVRREADFARSILARLGGVQADAVPHEDWLTLKILSWEANATVEQAKYYWYGFAVTPYSLRGLLREPFPSLKRVHDSFRAHTFASEADLAAYLALLRQYPALIGEHEARLAGQAERGILIPAEQIDQVVALLRSFVQPPGRSLFDVSDDRLEALDAQQRAAFRRDVAKVVEAFVNPALSRLIDSLDTTYRAQAPSTVGVGQYPGGGDYYRHLVRLYTTLDLSPEQIHRAGTDELTEIAARMLALRSQVGFQGTPEEFHRQLAVDPRFLARSAEEIDKRLMSFVEVIRPRLPDFFVRIPRAPYGVKRLDPALEGMMTYGYYQKPTATEPTGFYFFNASDLDHRSQLDAAALIAHELVPGHHMQMSLQLENEALPAFRREAPHTAFVEGWGLYSSLLAAEMGLYSNPFDEYGMLATRASQSSRLVVDTGMNALAWPRTRAAQFMRQNTLWSDEQIRTETLRYAADIPGQALAYSTGARRLIELRDKAKRTLGPRFDIRRFHDAVIGSGSMPLSVLVEHVDWFIRQQLKGAGTQKN